MEIGKEKFPSCKVENYRGPWSRHVQRTSRTPKVTTGNNFPEKRTVGVHSVWPPTLEHVRRGIINRSTFDVELAGQ